MNTDHEWQRWGQEDPYFGVITDPRFRRDRMTEEDRNHFFATGDVHVQYTLEKIRYHVVPGFTPQNVLDFGCGVGRLAIPFARMSAQVTGVDVSGSMLEEARRNADRVGLTNIRWLEQGDVSGLAAGTFDLVHSAIVLQHIDVTRGLDIFSDLIALLRPGGVGAIQVTYAKSIFAETDGIMPPAPAPELPRRRLGRRIVPAPAPSPPEPAPGKDPVMLMNSYPLTPVFFRLQRSRVYNLYLDFTDHGGELGVFLFFCRH